jgi:uncharacterized coiled-coil protein SlyX
LASLLLHLELGVSDVSDIYQVAEIINDVLQDDRLLLVPPELIFRIVLAADSKTIDQQLLIDFAMVLLYEDPAAAAPLILLLDFSLLTEDQAEAVFLTRELHKLNLNFFSGWAMTYIRNKAETELMQFRLKELNEVAMMKELLIRGQEDQALQVESRHREELARLQRVATDQQLELDRIMEEIANQDRQQELREADHLKQLSDLRQKIDVTGRGHADCWEATEDEHMHIQREVAEEIDRLRKEFSGNLGIVVNHGAECIDRIRGELKDGLRPIEREILELEEKTSEFEKTIGDLNEGIAEGKSVLAVKIVRDQLRFDKFVRTTKEKLMVFKGGGIWEINSKRAKAANQVLVDLQKSIDDMCPLRGTDDTLDE